MNESERLHKLQEAAWNHYAQHGRHELPWRQPMKDGTFDPYRILVSEIMLQQTQVPRVIPKYHEFLDMFPDTSSLASASLGDVLRVWQGLGYNRRAKFLWQAAQQIVSKHQGVLPDGEASLVAMPGIGANTAGAILAYAYDKPAVFIETNIRTVYIHHYFADATGVHDADIRALVAASLAHSESPRDFYWALMDYGAHLKQIIGNLNKLSKTYSKQSSFKGSRRQIRGAILRMLSEKQLSQNELLAALPDGRTPEVIKELIDEGLVQQTAGRYHL